MGCFHLRLKSWQVQSSGTFALKLWHERTDFFRCCKAKFPEPSKAAQHLVKFAALNDYRLFKMILDCIKQDLSYKDLVKLKVLDG
jgi:hypothetical protein